MVRYPEKLFGKEDKNREKVKTFKEILEGIKKLIHEIITEYGDPEKKSFKPGVVSHVIPEEFYDLLEKFQEAKNTIKPGYIFEVYEKYPILDFYFRQIKTSLDFSLDQIAEKYKNERQKKEKQEVKYDKKQFLKDLYIAFNEFLQALNQYSFKE